MDISLIYLEIRFYTTELTVHIWLPYGWITVFTRFWSRSVTHYMRVVLYNYFYVKLDKCSPVEVWINKILLFADYFVPVWYIFLNNLKCGNLFNYKYELYFFSSLQVKRKFYFEGSLLCEEESQRSQFILHFSHYLFVGGFHCCEHLLNRSSNLLNSSCIVGEDSPARRVLPVRIFRFRKLWP